MKLRMLAKWLLNLLAFLIFGFGCGFVGFQYARSLDAVEAGASAPASIAFLWGIPFMIGVIGCLVLAAVVVRPRRPLPPPPQDEPAPKH